MIPSRQRVTDCEDQLHNYQVKLPAILNESFVRAKTLSQSEISDSTTTKLLLNTQRILS